MVESPRSPPKGYFASRGSSHSPERGVNTLPFGKVQDLISQHSSRSSTRPSTPRHDSFEKAPAETASRTASGVGHLQDPPPSRRPSIPPPVNRADKPKIPSKPTPLYVQDLTSGTLERSVEKGVSPFSTPPSSGGSASPDQLPRPKLVDDSTAKIASESKDRKSSLQRHESEDDVPALSFSKDARLMGFSQPVTQSEQRDLRAPGFSNPRPSAETRGISSTPVRANTVSERSPSRDLHGSGPAGPRLAQRHVSETFRPLPSSGILERPPISIGVMSRDPRSSGFSRQTGNLADKTAQPAPSLPQRRTDTETLTRPSEEWRQSVAVVASQVPGPGPFDRSTKPRRPNQSGSVHLPLVEPNIHFPPPPKRNTSNSSEFPSAHEQVLRTTATTRNSVSNSVERPTTKHSIAEDSDNAEEIFDDSSLSRTEYPDTSQANRRPPFFKNGLHELSTKSDARTFDVCGHYVCTSGYATRVWDCSTGEQIMNLSHGETVKVLSVAFKPAQELKNEGEKLWIGNNIGELHELDIATQSVVAASASHNRREIIRILRHQRDLWTLDDEGNLFVWRSDESGTPNLKYSHQAHRLQKAHHNFSIVIQDNLWFASGKELRIYRPGSESSFTILQKPLQQAGAGDITSGTYTTRNGGKAFFGHTDGKVTIYSTKDYLCLANVKASDYKINGLAFVGDWLWTAYKTGKIYVYDTSTRPWKIKKDWRAHDGPAAGLILNPSSIWTLNDLQVASVGHDNYLRFWDGMLEDDWLENAMQQCDTDYCSFREIGTAVVTWNVGASRPFDLRSDFIADAIHSEDPPELLVFGFQEIVDLEDRAVTAKSILGFGKRKDTNRAEHVSRVYREWRDYLGKCIDRYTSTRYTYSELHTSSLIGLFQCIFVRQEERKNICKLSGADVKCGMKGHYGNKGALITRFMLNDSSLCFVNCHLAAGQTHTSHRNNDLASILEAESLPLGRDSDTKMSLFVSGGDGSQILDHEICILNGDLNYRIDAIPRDTVIAMIKKNQLAQLLERDQIMVSRRRVSGFKLSPFTELPITFAPTYKYDVGTDNYDSSEKRRAPAWCDRVLYRGPGKVKQVEYRRHEVRVSDHRPVSGLFRIRVKSINRELQERAKTKCYKMFGKVRRKLAAEARFVSISIFVCA